MQTLQHDLVDNGSFENAIPGEIPPVSHAAMNGNSYRAEFIALGSIIDAGNVPLPPFADRLLKNAPECFEDARTGQIAVTVRSMRETGEPVSFATIGEKHLPFLSFIGTNLSNASLPLDAAEYYAERAWKGFQVRRAKSVGLELVEDLERSPESARTICETAVAALASLNSTTKSLAERLALRMYDPNANLKKPAPLYCIGNVAVCTAGNLTSISAQVKGGKTASIAAMIASTFAREDADCFGFNSRNPQGLAVIHVDTEQSPYDHADLVSLISKRASNSLPAWFKSYCLTGWKADDIRRSVPFMMEQAKKEFGGVHCLVLDGVADAANDINDPAEANAFVAELHALAIKYDCAVICVIHLNPGSDFKTRGHLGSQLERKAETNLKCDKEDEIITLWADKNRHAPIPKKTAPRFTWNKEAGMHVSVASSADAKGETEIQELQIEAETVFHAAEKTLLKWVQIIGFLETHLNLSKSTAKRHMVQMLEKKIIRKELTGFYALNT